MRKQVVSISGLKVGDRIAIPGVETRKAIKSLYKLRLYDDVQLRIENTAGDLVFLKSWLMKDQDTLYTT